MYHIMSVVDAPLTRENSYGWQLYEEAQNNLSDKAYAESSEGQWERAVLCVEKTGRIPLGNEDRLVLVQLQRLTRVDPRLDGEIELRVSRRDYSYSFNIFMSVEGIIDAFERSEA